MIRRLAQLLGAQVFAMACAKPNFFYCNRNVIEKTQPPEAMAKRRLITTKSRYDRRLAYFLKIKHQG